MPSWLSAIAFEYLLLLDSLDALGELIPSFVIWLWKLVIKMCA